MRQTCVITGNFGGAVKPLLSNKVVSYEKITLVEDDNIVENGKNTASVLNEFLSNIITILGIPQYNETGLLSRNLGDPLVKAIIKHRFRHRLQQRKIVIWVCLLVSLKLSETKSWKKINNLKTNEATQSTDIPIKLSKENSDIFEDFDFGNYNNCVFYSIFPNSFENAIKTPVHKKGAATFKDLYRPVSILSNISKIHERLIFK